MYLELHNLLPTYFESVRKNNSEIWGKEITLSAGDLVKIVAPSGSGKTSLIHFIYGIRNDYQGKILFKDADIRKYTREDFAK
jgi:putative ABC transport system ATP-binding protein